MDSFWWCLTHSRVEEGKTGCANTDRLGPYASAREAEGALESVRQRTAAEDARDAAENDWGRPAAPRA